MPIVNYVREHVRFIEYASDEHLTASERLVWYALMHIMNQRAQGNIWPDEFIRVSNDRLLSFCPMKFDTMAAARNSLKQRGLIEVMPGEKNKKSPAYRMIYFYPQYAPPETERDGGPCYPEKSDYMWDNIGGNMGDNIGGNTGGNVGDISINNIYTNTKRNLRDIHTQSGNNQDYPVRARDMYKGLNDQMEPARYDSAWITSPRARGAVAQRVVESFGEPNPYAGEYERVVDLLKYGMPPELIEDIGAACPTRTSIMARVSAEAQERGYTEEKYEYGRCLTVANGNKALADALFRMRKTDKEETA